MLELKKELTGQPVDGWIQFFNSRTEEDLEMIKTKNAGIQEAIRILREMSLSGYIKDAYEAHLKAARDQMAREAYVRNEGRSEGKVEDILDLLEEKGAVPEELKKQISSRKDPDRLKEWLKLAANCDSVEEFQKTFRQD